MKFNRKPYNSNTRDKKTVNYEGGTAYSPDDSRIKLTLMTLSTLFNENKFYVSAQEHDTEIVNLIHAAAQKDPEFVLQLAKFLRNNMYLRSAPIVLLTEASMINECKPYVRKYTPEVIKRPDELTEVIAYWINRHGDIGRKGTVPFPNSLKKGLADAIKQLDEYQLWKYNRNGIVKLRDVINIVHPEPESIKQSDLFRYLLDETVTDNIEKITAIKKFSELSKKLPVTDPKIQKLIEKGSITWEVAVSAYGNKKEVWDSLNLPFMAGLRNLRNIINTGAENALEKTLDKLENPDAVKHSKQFPFRFYSAYNEVLEIDVLEMNTNEQAYNRTIEALRKAIEVSIQNVPALEGQTVIAVDTSGSMEYSISRKTKMTYKEIATLFGAMSFKVNKNSKIYAFATHIEAVPIDNKKNTFEIMEQIIKTYVGGGTNGYKIPQKLMEDGIKADNLIIFSDFQMYGDSSFEEEFKKYQKFSPRTKLFMVDLAGYGTLSYPTDKPNVCVIGGWSDKVLRLMSYMSRKENIIDIIKQSSQDDLEEMLRERMQQKKDKDITEIVHELIKNPDFKEILKETINAYQKV